MNILMFGWEFPPFKTGGLGTACYGLTKGLSRNGAKVTFVMPLAPEGAESSFVKIIGADKLWGEIKIKTVDSLLTPYMTSQNYEQKYNSISSSGKKEVYGKNLGAEVQRFSAVAGAAAKQQKHDVIHAHDWMTYQAGINAKKISGKPLVVHIHATEFDRTGGSPNEQISKIEYKGLKESDLVIANSNFTKNNVVLQYKINPKKIKVVHWGIDDNSSKEPAYKSPLTQKEKIVLFLGRVTVQKGPDYFIEAAKKVIEHYSNVKFVIAGDGDMLPKIINRAAEIGISDKVVFTGFLQGQDVYKAFQTADVYVMPSVSEPFGLVALEALKNNTPVIISKQSGVSEVLHNALKVDFWDVNEIANKIVNVLKYDSLRYELRQNGAIEAQKFKLDEQAKKCIQLYEGVIAR